MNLITCETKRELHKTQNRGCHNLCALENMTYSETLYYASVIT